MQRTGRREQQTPCGGIDAGLFRLGDDVAFLAIAADGGQGQRPLKTFIHAGHEQVIETARLARIFGKADEGERRELTDPRELKKFRG